MELQNAERCLQTEAAAAEHSGFIHFISSERNEQRSIMRKMLIIEANNQPVSRGSRCVVWRSQKESVVFILGPLRCVQMAARLCSHTEQSEVTPPPKSEPRTPTDPQHACPQSTCRRVGVCVGGGGSRARCETGRLFSFSPTSYNSDSEDEG